MIGDGRTAALVARDGASTGCACRTSIRRASSARILDRDRGGAFELQPSVHFRRRAATSPDTNVLETTFTTDRGVVRVVDAMTFPDGGLAPMRELRAAHRRA